MFMKNSCFAFHLLFILTGGYAAPHEWQTNQDARIIGGTVSKRGESPYMAVILQKNGAELGSGAIIDRNHILCAASAIQGVDIRELIVAAGVTDLCPGPLFKSKKIIGQQLTKMEWINTHESFNRTTMAHNIAIIKMQTPFVFGKFVRSVPLPTARLNTTTHNNCIVTGWGMTKNDGTKAVNGNELNAGKKNSALENTSLRRKVVHGSIVESNLTSNSGDTRGYLDDPSQVVDSELDALIYACDQRAGRFQTHEQDECVSLYNETFSQDNMLCAGILRDHAGNQHGGDGNACLGDAGVPLVCNNELHGIMARSTVECNNADIYTKIASYVKWINWNRNRNYTSHQ